MFWLGLCRSCFSNAMGRRILSGPAAGARPAGGAGAGAGLGAGGRGRWGGLERGPGWAGGRTRLGGWGEPGWAGGANPAGRWGARFEG